MKTGRFKKHVGGFFSCYFSGGEKKIPWSRNKKKGGTPLNTEQSAVVPVLVMHLAYSIGLELFHHLILEPVGKFDIL